MSSHDNREEALFERCLELPPDEREAYLREQCPDDLALVESVLSLLSSHDAAGEFLDGLPRADSFKVASRLERVAPTEERSGDQIGRYRLLELIGEGAWGSVWIARQTEDIDRQVALKILKVGLDTRDFLARFEAERQMLAMMDHPNIAHVIDAGSTKRGRPYLVMELVKGIQILEFADKNRLGIRERVKLFSKVCRAMHHAHCKGVVHRDLKPSNILVSAQYDEALPKVIDFGVAKSNQLRLTDKTLFTSMHAFVGTPVYSSPEQLEFTGRDVDSRSDIYSLGALLYELVCGATPFDSGAGGREEMAEFVRQVREEDPPRPSQRFSKLSDEERERIASRRGLSAGKLESLLKEDLDWIAIRCLEKDPALRYDTAKDLADDLQAFLDHQSVTASSPSPFYRMRRFVSRNRPAYAIWVEMAAVVAACFMVAFYYGVKKPNYTSSTPMEISSDSSIQFTDKSIAVLPLDNLSPDPENAFFADGVHEDIINNLSSVDELFVIGRTSTLQFRNTADSLKQIGDQLGVRYLVEGSVRRAGEKVRVTVQLIDSDTEGPLWTDSFNRNLDDTFAIQAEISKTIAEQLEATLSSEELRQIDHRPTTNQEAYDLFVRFRNGQRQEYGLATLEEVVALDPKFGEAWASMVIQYSFVWKVQYQRNNPALIERARYAMQQAEKWGDGMAFVPYAKSSLVWNESEDLEAAIDLLLEAVAISSAHDGARRNLGRRYYNLGRLSEAEHHLKKAVRLNPLDKSHAHYLFQIYHLQRKWEEAETLVEKNLQRNPGEPEWLWKRALLNYSKTGNRNALVQAIEANQEWIQSDPKNRVRSALFSRNFGEALKWNEKIDDQRFLSLFGEWGGFSLQSRELATALIWFQLDMEEKWQNAATKAQAYLEEITQNDSFPYPSRFASLAVCHALRGDSRSMEALIAKARDEIRKRQIGISTQSNTEITIAIAYLVQGDVDKALETLEELSKSDNPVMLSRVLDLWFMFDALRGNPRFEALVGNGEGSIGNDGIRTTQREDFLNQPSDFLIPDSKSIAILPFENLSGREEDELYSKGIHRTLLTRISQLKDLRSIAPSSVIAYRGTNKRLAQIASELGVAHLLTGDVQILGEAIRINVQLVEAASDRPLWGKTYTRDLTAENFFSIESEIAESIADTLMAVLTPQERDRLVKLPTRNTEALEVFIEGTSVMESAIQTRREEGIDAFRKAIDLDPGFVLAYVNLGRAYLSEASVSLRDRDWWEEAFENAEAAAAMALQLDSESAEAHTLLGRIQLDKATHWEFEGDLDLAKRFIERAVELNPNYAEAYAQRGELLIKELDEGVDQGKAAKRLALSWFRKAIDLDPQNHLYRNRLGFLLNELGAFDESREHFEAAVRINPEFAAGIRHLAIQMFSVFGQYDRAISLFRQAVVIDRTRFEPHELQYHCYWTLGDEREAFRWHKAGMGSGIGWNAGGPADEAKYRVAHYQMHDDHERYLEQLRVAVEKSSNWGNYRRLLLNEDMRDGRLPMALQRYEKLFPYLFEEEVVMEQQRLAAEGAGTMEPRNQALAAMELAEILVRLGEKERAYYLLDIAWDFFQRYPERTNWHWFYLYGYGIRDAVRFALRGEKEEALRAIREAVDEGFRDRLELESSALDSLLEESEFKAAMEIVEADWARQLANVRRMEADGELAPIPDDPRYNRETPAKILVEN